MDEAAPQHSPSPPTLRDRQANAEGGICAIIDSGKKVEVDNHGGVVVQMMHSTLETEKNSESQAHALLGQAAKWESTYERRGAVESLDNAIQCRSQALALTPEGHAERADRLVTLGMSFYRRFARLGETTDVNRAIECLTAAAELMPNGQSSKLDLLNHLGVFYLCRFEQLGELSDLEEAIANETQAVRLTPDGDADRPGRLGNLGNSYQSRFDRIGKLEDLNKAIECHTQAVLLTPDGDTGKPGRLNNLGNSHQGRFECLGELADVNKAIECQSQATLLTPDSHSDKPGRLSNLGTSYQYRFDRLGELADVDKAVKCQTQALLLVPDGHPHKPILQGQLGNAYMCRFDRLSDRADGDKAIECHTQAVLLTPEGHALKSVWLGSLGNAYQYRFERFGELADVDKAIECQTKALLLTPDGHAGKPSQHGGLGNSYLRRFERHGELADVDKAIECQTKALLLTPEGHVKKQIWYSNLGGSYARRFERLGELADVDKAIECQVQAVRLTPDGHADKPAYLNNLGISYLGRFQRLSERVDVDKAIECQIQAVLRTPDGHADKPSWLNNLGNSYLRRSQRFGEAADMDKGIEYQAQAVLLTPDSHADKSNLLSNLGNSYAVRFKRLGELADVDKAIECQTKSVLLTPDGHAGKPSRHGNLGTTYHYRFERYGELADLDKAIECHTQSSLIPDGHADKPGMLYNLGNSYMDRFQRAGQLPDLQSAQSSFQRAAQLSVTDPVTQIKSARSWAKSSCSLGISPLPAYERCMELIPRAIWLGATINQRYSTLATISDLAAEAAAWAISVQAYDFAIEWLEQGRSVVWGQILQLRTPFDSLSALNPTLAAHLKSVAAQLENAGTRPTQNNLPNDEHDDLEKDAQRHRRLADEWEKGLSDARNIPGLENFMQPRKAEELKRSATKGPIVLINTHATRCDALIILPQSNVISHLPLNNLSLGRAGELRSQLYSSLTHRGDTARGMRLKQSNKPDDSFKSMLMDIWSTIVKPILDRVCSRDTPVDELPHVTWCATGALSFLPLHAAGPYDDSSPNAFDLAISSYTPTLSALLDPSPSVLKPDVGLLVVGQESTPPLPALPFTVQELKMIEQHAKAIPYLELSGERAKVDAVLHNMEKHSWVHLACHASQDQSDPAQSAFYLCDGTLTLEAITKRQFKDKGLAFLSACQTATGDGKLPDEAVHLAAGMLMAGYPSVIATMWPMSDPDGPKVADRVYAELLEGGRMDHTRAAKALHNAVAGLRASLGQGSSERWRWVPFIHIGV